MRLQSLDLLRGSVMLFLTVLQPLLLALDAWIPLGAWTTTLHHVAWEGMHLWDLVMPCFIFMCGASVPFALPKYLEAGHPTPRLWRHLLVRVGMLWGWGLLIQGNALYFDWKYFYFYTNTLQAIAAGYTITVLVYLMPQRYLRFIMPFGLMAIYGALLAIDGAYGPNTNLAFRVERIVFPGGNGDPKYTWVLTTMMFGAMTLLGANCGEILKGVGAWTRKVAFLGLGAVALLLAGWLISAGVPMIKPIYTVSFTLMAMGCTVLALTLYYAIVDGLKFSLGFGLVTRIGRMALVVYVAHEFFGSLFLQLGNRLSPWANHHFGGGCFGFVSHLIAAIALIGLVYVWPKVFPKGEGR